MIFRMPTFTSAAVKWRESVSGPLISEPAFEFLWGVLPGDPFQSRHLTIDTNSQVEDFHESYRHRCNRHDR